MVIKVSNSEINLKRDICLLLGEYVVVSQLMIFPSNLLGSAEKPMAGPINSKGKIMSWDKFIFSEKYHTKVEKIREYIGFFRPNEGYLNIRIIHNWEP